MLIEFAESSHSLVLSKATWVLEDQRHDKFDCFWYDERCSGGVRKARIGILVWRTNETMLNNNTLIF